MRKTVCMILAGGMILTLAACGNGTAQSAAAPAEETAVLSGTETSAAAESAETTAAETSAAVETAETTAAETAALPNPMREVPDAEQFEKELGISVEPAVLYSEAELFILDDRIAELQFSFDNIMGEPVECCLRATKDPDSAAGLSGIYDSTLKEVNGFDYSCSEGDFTITQSTNDAGDLSVYQWKIGDVWYSFTLKGSPSGMELAEVLDSVLLATAGETEPIETAVEEGVWYELNEDATVLTVRLKANATTGNEWSYQIWDPAALEEITSEYIEDAHESGVLGVGGTWVASFRVPDGVESDEIMGRKNDIRFTYAREWEGKGIPSKTLDLLIHGQEMEILEVHEPDFAAAEKAEDGEYPVTLSFSDMQEENELSFYALVGIPEIITFTEEEVNALKAGDVITLSQYGLDDIPVETVEKKGEDTVVINDTDRLMYDEELAVWKIVGWDDDILKWNREKRLVHFTNETQIEDGMEEIMKTGNSGTIYDKMGTYWYVDADLTVKDGEAVRIVIHYHP